MIRSGQEEDIHYYREWKWPGSSSGCPGSEPIKVRHKCELPCHPLHLYHNPTSRAIQNACSFAGMTLVSHLRYNIIFFGDLSKLSAFINGFGQSHTILNNA